MLKGLIVFAAFTLVYTMAAFWVAQPSDACLLFPESSRRLYLERAVDREHLARDADRIHRVAQRYATPRAPVPAQAAHVSWCRARLTRQLAAAHGLPLHTVQAAMSTTR